MTDIRYRGDKIMAGSGDKKDIKGGAAIASVGGIDVVSEGGEKDAKNTASGDATMERDIGGGASSNIGNEIKVESEEGGATNKVRFASGGADSTGVESTVNGASVDNYGGAMNNGGDGVVMGASVDNGGDTNDSESAIINIGNEITGEKDKGGATNIVKSANGGADATGNEHTFLGASVDNSGGANNSRGGGVSVGVSVDNGGGANNGGCSGVSVGAVPRISRMRLREILQHAEGGFV